MPEELQHPYSQKAKVKKITENKVLLICDDQTEIGWPLNLLPPNTNVGDIVKVIIHNSETDEQERQKLAKTLINEILNSPNQ